jgi:hypothetical protein
MDPDKTARMRRLVWIHAGRKCTMLVLSWRGSYVFDLCKFHVIIDALRLFKWKLKKDTVQKRLKWDGGQVIWQNVKNKPFNLKESLDAIEVWNILHWFFCLVLRRTNTE